MKRFFTPIVLLIFVAPSVAFAAWWNPFDWLSFVKNIFFNEQTIVITPPVVEPLPSIASTTTDQKKEATTTPNETSVKPIKKVVITPKIITPNKTVIIVPAPVARIATTSSPTDEALKLLKEQNELLKQQVLSQQQIAQNTLPPVSPTPVALQSFKFSPIIEIGGKDELGFIHPEFSSSGCLACDLSDYNWVYLTINEQFDSVTVETTDVQTGKKEIHGGLGDYLGQPIAPGHTVGGMSWTVASNKTYDYKITAYRSGFLPSIVTGNFISRPDRMIAVRDTGGVVEEYLFTTYDSNPYIAQVQLKAKKDLPSGQIVYFPAPTPSSGENYSLKQLTNIHTDDIVNMENIQHSLGLHDASGKWLNITDYFVIQTATAKKNGQTIPSVLAPNTTQ